jgi:hypothetical protein
VDVASRCPRRTRPEEALLGETAATLDPVGDPGTEMVKAMASGSVGGFVEKVAPGLVEAGQWSADLIRWFRFKTAVKIFGRAQEMCEQAGINPQAVAWKTLVPLLENASLEQDPKESDDPDGVEAMHERWAALIANAANGDSGPDVPPAFPAILAQVTPAEAAILDDLAGMDYEPASVENFLFSKRDIAEPYFGQEEEDRTEYNKALVQVGNLQRLGLAFVDEGNEQLVSLAKKVYGNNRAPFTRRKRFGLTPLGEAFVAACTPPGERKDEDE